jgi:carboxylesterase type B
VVLYWTGGGDNTGGVNIPTQLPANWVHRSQCHIVVTTNYRVNIFGFPNARGLNGSTNFAMQDQRMTAEWVAENIAAFGGDPEKITLWGQSAGASAADMYLFAWSNDPIVRGSVSSTGVAVGGPLNSDQRSSTNVLIVDNRFVFSDYAARYQNGKIAKIPKMLGTTSREASPLVPYPVNNITDGPSEDLIVSRTLAAVCAVHNTSVFRDNADLATYRYEWAGNFSNVAPVSWLGAYHYSDLVHVFRHLSHRTR